MLSRAGRLLRFAVSRADDENLGQVAASLTFTTVLALVPLLTVAFALFTAFPLFGQFQQALNEFLLQSLMPPSVAENIMDHLNQFAFQASRLSAIGGVFLGVTAISLIMTIDKTFNDIWHVTRQRPLLQRVLVYWAVLSLGPLLLGGSLWATSFLARESLGMVGDVSDTGTMLLSVLPALLSAVGCTALFMVVPNRKVEWRDALAGGFGTALVLESMKAAFAWYLTQFPTYTVVYGAFATLPIFLLWIFMSWLLVLFGASVAASLPLIRMGRLDTERRAGAAFVDALGVLAALSAARGTVPPGYSTRFLGEQLRLSHDEVLEVLEALAAIGYVARIGEGAKERWAMVCDPHAVTLAPVFDRLLLDRNQPLLRNDPALHAAVARAWRDDGSSLTVAQALQLEPLPSEAAPGPAHKE